MARHGGTGVLAYDRTIAPFTCRRCGTAPDRDESLPLGWSTSSSDDEDTADPAVLCPRCTRDHVRDIEAKLDEQWWS